MKAGMAELRDLARWAQASGLWLTLTPVRHFRREGAPGWVEQREVGEAQAW